MWRFSSWVFQFFFRAFSLSSAPYYIRAGDLRRLAPHWFRLTEQMVQAADPNVAWSTPGGWIAEVALQSACLAESNPCALVCDRCMPMWWLRLSPICLMNHWPIKWRMYQTTWQWCQSRLWHRCTIFERWYCVDWRTGCCSALHFCQDYNLSHVDPRWSLTFKKHDWHQQTLLVKHKTALSTTDATCSIATFTNRTGFWKDTVL